MNWSRKIFGVLAFVFWTTGAAAELLRLEMPIDCLPGDNCWVINLVDVDPSPKARDYNCGDATYDGHKGVDFAIRDLETMRLGVAVLAAAPGEVVGFRDGMEDVDFTKAGGLEPIKGRECGNGVVIRHRDGWTTQYCHMLKNSLKVKTGDKVEAGDTLGLVGHSGMAQFPHLHIQVMRGGEIIDPFIGPDPSPDRECGLGVGHLWADAAIANLSYRPTALYNGGFAASQPKAEGVRKGLYRDSVLPERSPALVLWVDMFRVRKDDRLSMTITGPDGSRLLSIKNVLTETQARRFAYAGIPRKGLAWEAGSYKGEVMLERHLDGHPPEIYRLVREVELR